MIKIKTLSDGLRQDSDNFLLLRFIAAALVIYGHAPVITGGDGPLDLFLWLDWGTYSGSIAVDIFFVASGFLITSSYVRRPNIVDFAWARFIRIVPAFAACMLVSAYVVGPVFTRLPLGDYFAAPDTWQYVASNMEFSLNIRWDLPGVFADNPQRATVNGSIWTLPAEVRMYVWAGLLGLVGVLRWRWLFNLVLAALFAYGVSNPEGIPLVPLLVYAKFAGLFAAGAFCYINRDWFPVHGGLLLALIAVTWLCRATPLYRYLFAGCEVLFVFWFAYNTRWHGFNRYGDYSYGIYLWGYPAQQMVAAVFGTLPFLSNAFAGLCLALLFAVASWYVIEKPALRLKGAPSKLGRWIADRAIHRRKVTVSPDPSA